MDRRTFLRLTTMTAASPLWTSTAAADTGPIVKPLPADTFIVHGTNAETRWEALAGSGSLVPVDRFFVRNHTRTPPRQDGHGPHRVRRQRAELLHEPAGPDGVRHAVAAGRGRGGALAWRSETPLASPWNTQFYRFFEPDYPAEGELVGRQNTKSAFELPWNGTLTAGSTHHLTGRSWSGTGGVRTVEVSTDGSSWQRAIPRGHDGGWLRWTLPWRPEPGAYTLRARATDLTGTVQPEVAPHNTQGYLFGAVVDHPVTVS